MRGAVFEVCVREVRQVREGERERERREEHEILLIVYWRGKRGIENGAFIFIGSNICDVVTAVGVVGI